VSQPQRLDYCDLFGRVNRGVVARKEHTCSSCGGAIRHGDRYDKYTYQVEGEKGGVWHEDKICPMCAALAGWFCNTVTDKCDCSFNNPLEDFFGAYVKDDIPGLVEADGLPPELALWLLGDRPGDPRHMQLVQDVMAIAHT